MDDDTLLLGGETVYCSSLRRCPHASLIVEKDAWLCNLKGYCVWQLPNVRKDYSE